MTAPAQFAPTDYLLALAALLLTLATLVVATEVHLLCSFFCIHGDPTMANVICASKV